MTLQVGAQASVTHKYVAMVTAVVLMITELGGAIGSAVGASFSLFFSPRLLNHFAHRTRLSAAGAIWTQLMPQNLAKYLPNVSEEERETLFGSIVSIVSLDPSDPIRQGAISAYSDTMRVLIIVALVIGKSVSRDSRR